MQINTKCAAQSKVTDKHIQKSIIEANEQIVKYHDGLVVLKVIQQLLADGQGGKVLTKRFTDKVKAALPTGINLSIVYADSVMRVTYGHTFNTINLYSEGPAYLGYNFTKDLQRSITQFEETAKGYEADVIILATFADEYNAAINLVKDIMRKVPVLQISGLKYELPLMYFQGE